jgi:hypothetical protein
MAFFDPPPTPGGRSNAEPGGGRALAPRRSTALDRRMAAFGRLADLT